MEITFWMFDGKHILQNREEKKLKTDFEARAKK